MAVITQLNGQSIAQILSPYALGDLLDFSPASDGIENSNYFVTTEHPGRPQQHVMTLLEQPSYSGDAYVTILDVCCNAGLPVAALIRTRTGHPYGVFDARRVLLTPRLAGRHVHRPTNRQVDAVGRFVARLHNATARLSGVAAYPRDLPWLSERADRLRGNIGFSTMNLIDDAIGSLHTLMDRADFRALPRGIIHADLFRDNLLFDEQGLRGVIDFHHAARGVTLFDLAVAANDWCITLDGSLDDPGVITLLRAYHRIRGLTPQEVWLFGLFTIYAACVFLISRLVVTLIGGPDAPRKDPQEFERILCNRMRYPYQVDPRNL